MIVPHLFALLPVVTMETALPQIPAHVTLDGQLVPLAHVTLQTVADSAVLMALALPRPTPALAMRDGLQMIAQLSAQAVNLTSVVAMGLVMMELKTTEPVFALPVSPVWIAPLPVQLSVPTAALPMELAQTALLDTTALDVQTSALEEQPRLAATTDSAQKAQVVLDSALANQGITPLPAPLSALVVLIALAVTTESVLMEHPVLESAPAILGSRVWHVKQSVLVVPTTSAMAMVFVRMMHLASAMRDSQVMHAK